jgi:hypothetical protein
MGFHRFFYVNHDFPSFFHRFFYVSRFGNSNGQVPLACPEARRSPQGKLLLATASWNLHGQMCWNDPATLKRCWVLMARYFG